MSDQLTHYLNLWNLSNPQLLAQTVTSHIYIVTFGKTRAALKLLTPMGTKDERNGAVALRYFNGHGAVQLFREDEQAHLLEYVDGEDLTALVKRNEDEQATEIIADVLNKLHAVRTSTQDITSLTPLSLWFRSLFQKAESDQHTHSIYVRAARLAEKLLATPHDVHVLHGDIHHENIRHHSERGWLAFDPKGLLGERSYDAANTLCNPLDMPTLVENERRLLKNAEILAEKAGFDHSRLLAFVFVYACLSASWTLEDGGNPRHALRIAEIVEPYVEF
jgi:streptomycin 6-kinase